MNTDFLTSIKQFEEQTTCIGLAIQSNDSDLGISLSIENVNRMIKESYGRYLESGRDDSLRFSLGWGGFIITVPGCGSELRLYHIDDLPREDTPCPCGNPNHWLVKYSIIQI